MRTRTWLLACVAFSTGCSGAVSPPAPTETRTPEAVTTAPAPATTTPLQTTATTATTAPSPATTIDPISGLADTCSGLTGTETVVAVIAELVLEITPSGGLRCIVPVPDDASVEKVAFSPDGQKLLFGNSAVLTTSGPGLQSNANLSDPEWTFPTGANVIALADDGTVLKAPAAGGPMTVVSAIDDVRDLAYHPDGLTFAVYGSDRVDDEVEGESFDQEAIYVIANDGSRLQPLVFSDAVAVDELVFSPDGGWLFYTAEHLDSDERHLHAANVQPFAIDGLDGLWIGGAVEEAQRSLFTGPASNLVTNPGDASMIAIAAGTCRSGLQPTLLAGDFAGERPPEAIPLLEDSARGRPVGFLAADGGAARVLILTSESGCEGPYALVQVDVDLATGKASSTPLLASVDAAATWAPAVAPEFTLADVNIEGFA